MPVGAANIIFEVAMSFKEIAEAKKCVLTTADWDAYQVIIRTCLKHLEQESPVPPGITLSVKSQQPAGDGQRHAVN